MFVPPSIYSQVSSFHNLVHAPRWRMNCGWHTVLQQDTLPQDEVITWSGATLDLWLRTLWSLMQVVPTFSEESASPSMIKRVMQLNYYAGSLHLLKQNVYPTYCSNIYGSLESHFRSANPQFKCWSTIMELLICNFIWSLLREISHSRSKYLISFAHGFIWWTMQIMQDGSQCMAKLPHKVSLMDKDQSHDQSSMSL